MKLAVSRFIASRNLGDEIQTLAAMSFLPQKDLILDRESMDTITEPCTALINGWFLDNPKHFPPSKAITPVFAGLFVTYRSLIAEHVDYWKKHEPIGCRDHRSLTMFQQYGIQAEDIGCLAVTLPRPKPLNPGAVYAVDWPKHIDIPFPVTEHITHLYNGHREGVRVVATDLLRKYAGASLVVTSRLHCALVCLAFGTPCVFYSDPDDPRLQALQGHLPVHYWRSAIDWKGKTSDVSAYSAKVTAFVTARLKAVGVEANPIRSRIYGEFA